MNMVYPNSLYQENIEWLEALNQNKIVPGLERIEKLMNLVGDPQKKARIIMVGGTNAKGSTCFNLNHNLTRAGLRVGCFTSPHLHSIRERIKIGNENIIREVTLFPMNQYAQDLMMDAPSEVSSEQLKELNIKVLEKK